MPSKVLMVIVDGMGDLTIPSFGERTPLEVAHVPYLNAVAGELAAGEPFPLAPARRPPPPPTPN